MKKSPAKEYEAQIHALLTRLQIPLTYGKERKFPLQWLEDPLVDIGQNLDKKMLQLIPEAANAWAGMQQAAMNDGIELLPISAYRSVDYQAQLIEADLAKGKTLETILELLAAPGYSEHHTGRALDLGTTGCYPIKYVFDKTPAYAWLTSNAAHFKFYLSFPEGNPHGMRNEPWHWCYWRTPPKKKR